jgi:hypothetical protein
MANIQDYLNLITSEHSDKPKFMAMLEGFLAPFVQCQTVMQNLYLLFDLDTPPTGVQLDIIGQYVGVSRNLTVPLTGIFFTWDSTAVLGWDSGSWQDPNSPQGVTTLPDAAYLTLLRARIAANGWDGTTEGAYKILNIVFPNINFLIFDNQNMSFTLGIQGQVLDATTIALITGGYIQLRPEGVSVVDYIIPSDANPFFAWDTETDYVQGWDQGSWGTITPGSI